MIHLSPALTKQQCGGNHRKVEKPRREKGWKKLDHESRVFMVAISLAPSALPEGSILTKEDSEV